MSGYEPEDRELFERAAIELYEALVQEGGIAPDDARFADGTDTKAALDLLAELNLVQLDQRATLWRPLEPAGVQSRVVTPLSNEGARLLDESARWAKAFQSLSHTWRRSPVAESSGPFTYLHNEAINPYLTALVGEAEEELLTAQPQAGRDAQSIATAALRDTEALDRGLTMRILYQHSARRSAITQKYVAAVTSRGAEVRTLDEFFNRMIVVDRRVAVIPAADTLATAVVVREPAVVAYLIDVFERAWARGRSFAASEESAVKEIAAEQRSMTIRMLIAGHADAVSAKRLGVSPRTYAGYVADLKAEYDADTRFQLGYTMGSTGISGNERSEESAESDQAEK
ncbi:LuxR family transcriptional regulator [Nocardioides humilatus]|uniref:LuxR family transcriptional regulator n=1 Tax=Nocardioides humilatus TaxID=2607660 RepID=A0A5B1LPZ1_9ACTN|nr:LuxR family transcriptional regulator [Nocardioides humilatus]